MQRKVGVPGAVRAVSMSAFDYPLKEAIFSDGTELFRSPSEPERNSKVTVRLRMPNAEGFRAFVIVNGRRIPMRLFRTHLLFSLYDK